MKPYFGIALSLAAATFLVSFECISDDASTEAASAQSAIDSARKNASICGKAIESFLTDVNVRTFLKKYAEEMDSPDAIPLLISDQSLSVIKEKDPLSAELTEIFCTELFQLKKVTLADSLRPRTEADGSDIPRIRIAGTLQAPRLTLSVYGHSDEKTDREHPGEPKKKYFFEIDDLHTGFVVWMFSQNTEDEEKISAKKEDKDSAFPDKAVREYITRFAQNMLSSARFIEFLRQKQDDQEIPVLCFQKPVNNADIPDWKISEITDLLIETLSGSPNVRVTRAEGAARKSSLSTRIQYYARNDNYDPKTLPKPGSIAAADIWIVLKTDRKPASNGKSDDFSLEIRAVNKKNGNTIFTNSFVYSKQ